MLTSAHRILFSGLIAMAVCCATPLYAAHPLLTEDTGTQSEGKFQLEASYDASRDRDAGVPRQVGLFTGVLSYGLAETLDILVGMQRLRVSSDDGSGAAIERGLGDASLDLKWRFYDEDGLSFGVKPGVTFFTGDERSGLGQGKAAAGAILIVSRQTETWALHGHLGARRNNNTIGLRTSTGQFSGAALYKASERLRLVLDAGVQRNPDPAASSNLAFLVLGAIVSPSKNLDLDVGFRRGLNRVALDRVAGAGVTIRW